MVERDRIGNALSKAKNLGTLRSVPTFSRDFVGKSDLTDVYRFGIGDRSSFNLQLSNVAKGAKLRVEVFSLKGNKNKVLKAIGRQDLSLLKAKDLNKRVQYFAKANAGKGSNPLQLALNAGQYYLRISARKGETPYRVGMSATLISSNSGSGNTGTPGQTGTPGPTGTPSVRLTRQWAQQFGTSSNDYGYGIALVGNNLYVSGSTEGNLNGTNQGDRDSYAALFTTSGVAQWKRQFGASGFDVASAITADTSGNYSVGGVDVGTAFGAPDPNGYLTRYNSSGTSSGSQSVKFLGADAVSGVTTDQAGNIYAAGFVKGIPGASAAKPFVAKYNSSGQELWFKELSGENSGGASGVAIDKLGNVYIAGITNATLKADFSNPFSEGDVFVAKYDANGTKLWDRTIATAAREYARGIAVDGSGNVYITGDTEGTLPGQTRAGGVDGFVAKYNTNGTQQWLRQFGTTGLDESQGIAVTEAGTVFLTGETTGGLFNSSSFGGSDAWLATYTSSGSRAGGTQIGTAQDDEAYGIATNGSSVYVLGQTQGTIAGSSNQGQYDTWLARYNVSFVS